MVKLLIAIPMLFAGSLAVIVPNRHLASPDTQPEHAVNIETQDAPKPIAPFVHSGIEWLVQAQYENGGWGAGQHHQQDLRDPHAVSIDPATTAFAAMALLRAGNTYSAGKYSPNVRKALHLLLEMIENAPNGPNITAITGTQPQRKIGQNIDVAMASQFLTQIKSSVTDKQLLSRIDKAMQICVEKLQEGQNADGSYAAGGWAPVLQSAMATNALESAQRTGYVIDGAKLDKAREYQKSNVDSGTGAIRAEDAAGISLYAISSTQRASAEEANKVRDLLQGEDISSAPKATVARRLRDRGVSEKEAEVLADAYVVNTAAAKQLQNEDVLRGFGNNGGEEFLSFMMTSESLAGADPAEYDKWHAKMDNLLSSVQNPNGSWSGHHCITSPVFCTAAVILTMTADRAM